MPEANFSKKIQYIQIYIFKSENFNGFLKKKTENRNKNINQRRRSVLQSNVQDQYQPQHNSKPFYYTLLL